MYLKILNEGIIENVHAVNKRAHWNQGLPYYNEETFMFEYPDGSTSVNLLKITDAPERFKLSTPEPQTSSYTTTPEVDVVVQAKDAIDNSDLPEEKKRRS